MLKNQKISFRCTDKEKEKIQKKAGQHGIPVGEYVLEAALSGGKRIKGVSKDVVIELVEVTTMINELQMEISRYAVHSERVEWMSNEQSERRYRKWLMLK